MAPAILLSFKNEVQVHRSKAAGIAMFLAKLPQGLLGEFYRGGTVTAIFLMTSFRGNLSIRQHASGLQYSERPMKMF